jgi:hypothetical protein
MLAGAWQKLNRAPSKKKGGCVDVRNRFYSPQKRLNPLRFKFSGYPKTNKAIEASTGVLDSTQNLGRNFFWGGE